MQESSIQTPFTKKLKPDLTEKSATSIYRNTIIPMLTHCSVAEMKLSNQQLKGVVPPI